MVHLSQLHGGDISSLWTGPQLGRGFRSVFFSSFSPKQLSLCEQRPLYCLAIHIARTRSVPPPIDTCTDTEGRGVGQCSFYTRTHKTFLLTTRPAVPASPATANAILKAPAGMAGAGGQGSGAAVSGRTDTALSTPRLHILGHAKAKFAHASEHAPYRMAHVGANVLLQQAHR